MIPAIINNCKYGFSNIRRTTYLSWYLSTLVVRNEQGFEQLCLWCIKVFLVGTSINNGYCDSGHKKSQTRV